MISSLKKQIPEPIRHAVRSYRSKVRQKRLAALPPFSEADLYRVLTDELGIQKGQVVFFHSASENLRPSFPLHQVLTVLREVVGESGTLLTPTYPRQSSYDFLQNGHVFNVRKTPSYMGALSELFRRTEGTIRSLHPTKSVCALGPHAEELTNTHQLSPYPFSDLSPYYKIMQYNGIIINLGVSPLRLSFVHCTEDALKDNFPIQTYLDTLFEAKCINYDGQTEIVKTYAHDPTKMYRNTERYIAKHIATDTYRDVTIQGRRFFRADACRLYEQMIPLAQNKITAYAKKLIKK